MSSNLPLRTLRIPALQRQCLFQRRALSSTPPRPFASTSARLRGSANTHRPSKAQQKAGTKGQVGRAPSVNMEEMTSDTNMMAEDIGILQDTMVYTRVRWGRDVISKAWPLAWPFYGKRQPSLGTLLMEKKRLFENKGVSGKERGSPSFLERWSWNVWSWVPWFLKPWLWVPPFWTPDFWRFLWKTRKAMFQGIYSRILYTRMVIRKGWWKRNLPIDMFDHNRLASEVGQKLYKHLYDNFAKGDISPVQRFLLPPLTRELKKRIAARETLKMKWELVSFDSRVVSHRVQTMGEESPNTAYRQVVVRIDSTQKLTLSVDTNTSVPDASPRPNAPELRWVPDDVQDTPADEADAFRFGTEFFMNGEPQQVTEYLVLQNRLISGKEEGWKVQGFAKESTPASLRVDEEYWNRTLKAQVAEMT